MDEEIPLEELTQHEQIAILAETCKEIEDIQKVIDDPDLSPSFERSIATFDEQFQGDLRMMYRRARTATREKWLSESISKKKRLIQLINSYG